MSGESHFTLPAEESSMGCAEVISLPEVRARKQWEALRQQLHERFDRWLDEVEAQLPASAPTLAQVSETIWTLRQQLTGGVAQTIRTYAPGGTVPPIPAVCHMCASLTGAPGAVSYGGDPDRGDRSAPPVFLLPALSPRLLSAGRGPGFACGSHSTRRATGRGGTGNRITV